MPSGLPPSNDYKCAVYAEVSLGIVSTIFSSCFSKLLRGTHHHGLQASLPSTEIPTSTITLIERFLAACDHKSDGGGGAIADCFAPEGKWIRPNITANDRPNIVGPDEIRSAPRGPAWQGIASRNHTVTKIYVCDAEARDLMIIGGLETVLEGGKRLDPGFAARVVLDESQEEPKFILFQGWTDTGVLKEAFRVEKGGSR